MFALLEGSKLVYGSLIDSALMLIGAVLIFAYIWLVGDFLELRFKADRRINLPPILLALGVAMLYQAVFRAGLVTLELKLSMAIPGIAIIFASAAMSRLIKRK